MQKKNRALHIAQIIFIIFSAFLVGYLLDLSQTGSLSYAAKTVFQTNVSTYIVTSIILFLIYMGLYGLINRFFYSSAIFYIFFAIYGIANRLKVIYRAEPILPSDLALISNAKELLSMVTAKVVIVVVVAIIVVVAASVFLEMRFGKKLLRFKVIPRVIFVVLALISLGSFYTANREGSLTNKFLAKIGYSDFVVNINWSANTNGPMLTFLSNVHIDVMDEPSGYNEATMNKLVKKYQGVADDINQDRPNNDLKKQTLIFVLSESFADPKRVPNIKLNHEVAPNLQNIKKNNTSGLMMSSGYGGGTANMEYMTFTGLAYNLFSKSLTSPYTQLVTKQNHPINIANSFDTTAAIHPYDGNFYDRNTVYQKFGIQTFRNISTTGNLALKDVSTLPYSPYVSDQATYNDTLDQINQAKGGQFINVVTMQNHMPYLTKYANNQFKVSGKGAGKNLQQVKNYSKGINITDTSTQKFLNELDKINKPITIVWYGDHLPGIYDGNSMSKYDIVQHETDYFVYSNKYALEHGDATQKINDATQITDPNGFIPLALKQMKQKVTPYYALLTRVQEELPAMAKDSVGSNPNLYVDKNGKRVSSKDLTAKQKQLLKDYKLVQYDLTAGKDYSKSTINK
ncbi:hypothetical protein FD29_GL001444 [Companilactobacillus mindensis DSM 14500]|uniref:Sulfatase N-terminal domain-containing protein n=3 Tax=Companilactobacillus mindensis TaxID=167481 RepID=A0A0R1QQG8_9LACO|nr:hypothetical protein FD29_GL001444 [Companilactobacillus mindensis DSM 14500]